MIKPLRKKHLQIWLVLLILLPTGIVSGLLVIPKAVKDNVLQPASREALPVVIKTIEKGDYTVNLRSNNDHSSAQLEWISKSVLTVPSAIIYRASAPAGGEVLEGVADIIGRIDARGIYRFPLKKDSVNNNLHFIIYDIIHHRIVDHINF